MSLHGKKEKRENEMWLIYRAVGLFYSHPFLIEQILFASKQIEHKLPITLFRLVSYYIGNYFWTLINVTRNCKHESDKKGGWAC